MMTPHNEFEALLQTLHQCTQHAAHPYDKERHDTWHETFMQAYTCALALLPQLEVA